MVLDAAQTEIDPRAGRLDCQRCDGTLRPVGLGTTTVDTRSWWTVLVAATAQIIVQFLPSHLCQARRSRADGQVRGSSGSISRAM